MSLSQLIKEYERKKFTHFSGFEKFVKICTICKFFCAQYGPIMYLDLNGTYLCFQNREQFWTFLGTYHSPLTDDNNTQVNVKKKCSARLQPSYSSNFILCTIVHNLLRNRSSEWYCCQNFDFAVNAIVYFIALISVELLALLPVKFLTHRLYRVLPQVG